MSDVIIRKKSNVHISLQCNDGIHKELSQHYTFYIPNFKHHPLVKAKVWDGKIRLYNPRDRTVYAGLLPDVQKTIQKFGYTCESLIDYQTEITPEEVVQYCDSLKASSQGKAISFRDYQYASVYVALKHKRRIILSPTASGKSLVIYSIVRYLLENPNAKILILVSKVSLVKQIYGDFVDYARLSEFDPSLHCHTISSGVDKDSDKRVYISTYQSVYKQKPEYFKKFNSVIVDEVHEAKSSSFVKILEACTYADYRIGLTGTLDGWEVNELAVQGLLGKKVRVAETFDLIERGDLAQLQIKFYELQYPKQVKKDISFTLYEDEMDWLVRYKRRNHFIKQLANSLDGNVLILFTYVEKHGKILNDLISRDSSKKVHFLHGGIDPDKREKVRNLLETSSDNITIASFGIFSTGINIRNLHHIILASTTKSVIRVLQSIGRGLRKSDKKDLCVVHDVCDNLVKKTKQNFSLQHGLKRIEIYNNQRFDYEIIRIEL